jgi:hypothetical protein
MSTSGGSNFDTYILPNPSSDMYDSTYIQAWGHVPTKGKYANYNYSNYQFPIKEDKSNLQVYLSPIRQCDCQPKQGLGTNQTLTGFMDFDYPDQLPNGVIDSHELRLTLKNNHTTNTANLCSVLYMINHTQQLKGGNTDISNQIDQFIIYLENCLAMNGSTKASRHKYLGLDTTNLNYTSNNTIGPLATRNYYLNLPWNWTKTYFLRDAVQQRLTIRVYFSNFINIDNSVLSSQISIQSAVLRIYYHEIPNVDYVNLLKQPQLNYRMWDKGSTSQAFSLDCVSGVSQNFQINSIAGDVCALIVFIRPNQVDVSGCLYDTYYPINSIEFRNQSNQNLTANIVPLNTDEIVDYAVKCSDHDFWTYRNVYLVPFTNTFVDCIRYNKINGTVRLPQPMTRIYVTPGVTQAGCTLFVYAYVVGMGQILGGTLTDLKT